MALLAVSVVIPAYNESAAIGPVIEGLREALRGKVSELEILVVDDGSLDGTGQAALSARATVVRHPVNRGYGQSLETGLAAAKHDWVLMIDADGSYPVDEAPKLLEFAPAFDLIIGTRTGVHFWGSKMQAFLRWVYLRIASFIVGESIPDANSGLRLVRRALASQSKGPVRCLGFSHSTTMTLSFLQDGRFVKFLPIAFQPRVGKSKVRPVRDILRTLQLMLMVMIAYNPTKLFVALAAVPAAAALLLLLGWLCAGGDARLVASSVLALAAVVCFTAGCLLEAMRMVRSGQFRG